MAGSLAPKEEGDSATSITATCPVQPPRLSHKAAAVERLAPNEPSYEEIVVRHLEVPRQNVDRRRNAILFMNSLSNILSQQR